MLELRKCCFGYVFTLVHVITLFISHSHHLCTTIDVRSFLPRTDIINHSILSNDRRYLCTCGDCNTIDHLSMFVFNIRMVGISMEGGCYPSGGSESLAKELVPVIQRFGGNVFIRANVDRILVEGTPKSSQWVILHFSLMREKVFIYMELCVCCVNCSMVVCSSQ